MTKSVPGEDPKDKESELGRRLQQGGWKLNTHTFYTKEVPRDLDEQVQHEEKGAGAISRICSVISRTWSGKIGIVPALILFLLVFLGLLIFILLYPKLFIPCVLLAAVDICWFATRYTSGC
jgi:hypothetical protein